ncbi:MAG TPA: GerMN domain-containing protein [Candidatus Binatia bacterium]|nr:GerMN domain-containing protein [Candidatus Binatia bacterium]
MKANKVLVFLTLLFLHACGTLEISIDPTPTPIPTLTPPLPTNTATPVLSPTVQIDPTATQTILSPTPALPASASASSTAAPQTVKVFLIAIEDNGQSGIPVGCGDSALPVTVTIARTQGVLKAALQKLLGMNEQFYGASGLYNALYQSDLELKSVAIDQGKAIIHLTGTLMLGGVCDNPRVEAQIEQTALQFSTVREVAVFLNGTPLEEILSQQ